MKEKINNYLSRLKNTLDNLSREEIETFINVLNEAREQGRTIFIMGNGGSAATASHYVCDFNKGASYMHNDKKRFKFICLNDNVASMMAYANDVSFEDIFVEQLKNYFNKGDVVIGISGSGNSKNVLNAIEYANQNGGITVGLTGYNGGKLKQMAKYSVNTNIDDMQISEDVHMIFDHMIIKILD
ncbi:MAG: SIS domain-containing protein [bacterium]|nr:SIS domain-containing protein [bacterium]